MGHLLGRQWHIHTARCWELPLSLPLLNLGLTAWRRFLINQGNAAFARLGPKISWSLRHPTFLPSFLLQHHIHLRYGLFLDNIFLISMKLIRTRYGLFLNLLCVSSFLLYIPNSATYILKFKLLFLFAITTSLVFLLSYGETCVPIPWLLVPSFTTDWYKDQKFRTVTSISF